MIGTRKLNFYKEGDPLPKIEVRPMQTSVGIVPPHVIAVQYCPVCEGKWENGFRYCGGSVLRFNKNLGKNTIQPCPNCHGMENKK